MNYKKPIGEPERWITVNGQHIPIYKGQTNMDAIYWNSINGNKPEVKSNSKKAVTEDMDKKEKQIASNKQIADELNTKDSKKKVDKKSVQDREKVNSKVKEHIKEVVDANEDSKEKQLSLRILRENNSKNGPNADDVYDPKAYFKNTDVEVTTSLAKWQEDVDNTHIAPSIAQAVSNYMDDSTINAKLRNHIELSPSENRQKEQLDRFTKTSKVEPGTILYSGLTSEDAVRIWTKDKSVNYESFLSTSPDPTYARGYALNTDTMIQIKVKNSTPIGKTYYSDSTGTEGILGRDLIFRKVGEKVVTVNGDKVRMIIVGV